LTLEPVIFTTNWYHYAVCCQHTR